MTITHHPTEIVQSEGVRNVYPKEISLVFLNLIDILGNTFKEFSKCFSSQTW